MENILQTILKKLEGIESKIKTLETGVSSSTAAPEKVQLQVAPVQKDELLEKAWDIISKDEKEEISSEFLAKALDIDLKRAEKIFDQLEQAGYGACTWKEA